MSRLFPQYYAAGVACIGDDFLKARGIRAILLDIDNTISLVDDPLPTPEAERWIRWAQRGGYAVGVISNNDPPRVEPFAKALGLLYVSHAQKPDPSGFLTLAEQAGFAPEHCLVVGDQLFTDMLGGNRAGMCTVAVEPLCPAMEPKSFRLRRGLEGLLLRLHRRFLGESRFLPKAGAPTKK